LKAGFQPGHLYLTYVLRRRPQRSYNKDVERRLYVSNLEEQLLHHTPSLLLCLENVALRTFTGNQQVCVKDARQHW
jgi:DNA polymerase